MSDAEFVWSYDACRKMDSLARKAYKQITGDSLPAGPVNHRIEHQTVELLPIEQLDIDRGMKMGCGTPAGWTRHRRSNEKPCEACRLAHNKKTAEYKARQRAKRKAS